MHTITKQDNLHLDMMSDERQAPDGPDRSFGGKPYYFMLHFISIIPFQGLFSQTVDSVNTNLFNFL